MAPHSNTLAWKIPWMEEPGGLQSMGSLEVRHDLDILTNMENARQLNLWLLVIQHKWKKIKKHFTAVDTNLKKQFVDTYLSGHYYKHKPPKHMSTFNVLQWHPTPVLVPGKSHGWRGLVGCSPWGR